MGTITAISTRARCDWCNTVYKTAQLAQPDPVGKTDKLKCCPNCCKDAADRFVKSLDESKALCLFYEPMPQPPPRSA